VRLVVTALAVACAALLLVGCTHEKTLQDSPEQIAKEQAAADAHNANTVPFAGDDESPATTDEPSTTVTTDVQYSGGESLSVGDCIDLPAFNAASVRAIPCDQPHHAEVTARVDVGPRFPDGAPTAADYQQIVGTDCQRAFDAYVRQPTPTGIRNFGYGPTPEAWYQEYRIVTCVAEADREGNVLTGSVRK